MAASSQPRFRYPSLRLHKASGLAVVTVKGRDIYCGKYGSPEADKEYRVIIAEYLASGAEVVRHHGLGGSDRRRSPLAALTARTVSVAELLLAYIEQAEIEYQPPSRELEIIKNSCKTVREIFGFLSAEDFGPRHLKAVRQQWIEQNQSRPYINAKISRIVRIWRWAGEYGYLAGAVWPTLRCVRGLRAGRLGAKEPQRPKPVPEADFLAPLPGLSPAVRAIVEVLWWTAARSGEITGLRTCDIVRDGEPWQYRPEKHKNTHRGHDRVIFFGPRARAILLPFLDDDNPDKFIFSPAAAVRARQEAARKPHRTDARRATAAANKRRIAAEERREKTGKSRPKSSRRAGDKYNRHSLANALRRCCDRLGVAYFNPHRLRHTARVRIDELAGWAASAAVTSKTYASEETQATLSHASRTMTKRYGGVCYGLAADTMERFG